MRNRCFNPKNKRYAHYGALGVTVCDRWLMFETFLEDMGERPLGTTLGRFGDVDNYEPGNCKWMTPAEQGASMRLKRRKKSLDIAA